MFLQNKPRSTIAHSTFARFVITVAAMTAAFSITFLLLDLGLLFYSGFFISATALAAWYGGKRFGVLAVVLGGLCEAWLRPPAGSFRVESPAQWVGLFIFIGNASVIVFLIDRLQENRVALHRLEVELIGSRELQRGGNVWEYDFSTETFIGRDTGRLVEVNSHLGLEQWLGLVHPDDKAMVRENLKSARDTGSYSAKVRITGRDGAMRDYKQLGYVVYDKQGRPERIVGVNVEGQSERGHAG